jgi:hypothetical protein
MFWKALTRSAVPDLGSRPAIHVLAHLRPRQLRGASVVEAVETLLGPMTRRAGLEVTRQMAVNGFRNVCVRRVARWGGSPALAELLREVDTASIRELPQTRPAILALWHMGPATSVFAEAFAELRRPVLLLRRAAPPESQPPPPGVEYLVIGDSAGAFALKRSLEQLARGGLVAFALDGNGQRMVEVSFFGRRYAFSRSAAMLARLAGASIVPVAKTWRDDATIDVRSYAPIPLPPAGSLSPDDFDRAATQELVRWFETFLRGAPEQFRLRAIPSLWRARREADAP